MITLVVPAPNAEPLTLPLGEVSLTQSLHLLGYLFGMVLHGALVLVLLRRREREHSERIFLALAIALFVWFFGQILAMLFAPANPGRIIGITRYFHLVSGVGLVLSPSLLVHMLLAFYLDRFHPAPFRHQRWLLIALYLPVLYYLSAGYDFTRAEHPENFVEIARNHLDVFAWHSLAYFFVFAVALIEIARQVERRDERRFFRALAAAVLANGLLIVAAFPLSTEMSPRLRDALQLSSLVSGSFPTVLFSYFLYRYRSMESLVRRSLAAVVLATFIMTAYQFAIKPLVRTFERSTALNASVVEILLLLALFAGLGAMSRVLRWLATNVLARRQVATRDAVRELSRRLSLFSRSDLAGFLRLLEDRIQELLRVQPVRIMLTDERVRGVRGAFRAGYLREADFSFRDQARALLKHFKDAQIHAVDLYEHPPVEIAKALVRLSSEYVLPIRGEAGALLGLVSAGRRVIYNPLLPEEKELLLLLVNQLAVVIEHVFATEEKIALQRKMVESEKLATLGMLSASVAHEVRNPLSSMKSILCAWRESLSRKRPSSTDSDPAIVEDFTLVIDEIDRLARTVNQLLTFARDSVESDATIGLRPLLDDVVAMTRHEATTHGVKLIVDCPEALGETPVPRAALKEALLNLVLNGIQAIEERGTVTLAGALEDERLHLTVSDSGPGIPAQLRDQVITPFFTTKSEGTGLGLLIVQDRVLCLGGAFSFDEGLPTTARLVLPLAARLEDGSRAESGAAAERAEGEAPDHEDEAAPAEPEDALETVELSVLDPLPLLRKSPSREEVEVPAAPDAPPEPDAAPPADLDAEHFEQIPSEEATEASPMPAEAPAGDDDHQDLPSSASADTRDDHAAQELRPQVAPPAGEPPAMPANEPPTPPREPDLIGEARRDEEQPPHEPSQTGPTRLPFENPGDDTP